MTPSVAAGREPSEPCRWIGHHEQLERLKSQSWEVERVTSRNTLALELADCLASPDPVLRDDLAFSALQTWLRSKRLERETRLNLYSQLKRQLESADPTGFGRPFAALALAEIARSDRLDPFLSQEQRRALVSSAAHYLVSVTDYRGFDDAQGWRHGVAHGADLAMQLSLNPALGAEEFAELRSAVAAQIAPGTHSYIFGEPERLATAILFLARRRAFDSDDWSAWIAEICAPTPLQSWDQAFKNSSDLARLHNLRAFLKALYVNAQLSQTTEDDLLLAPLSRALLSLP